MEVCSKYVWNRPKKESEIESVGSLKKANFFRKRGFQRQKMISFLLGIAVFFFFVCVLSALRLLRALWFPLFPVVFQTLHFRRVCMEKIQNL